MVVRSNLHSLPEWFGWFLIILGIFLVFPSLTIMVESSNAEIWQIKINNIGILYAFGTLVWSFVTWILLAIFVAIGVDVVKNKDKSTPD